MFCNCPAGPPLQCPVLLERHNVVSRIRMLTFSICDLDNVDRSSSQIAHVTNFTLFGESEHCHIYVSNRDYVAITPYVVWNIKQRREKRTENYVNNCVQPAEMAGRLGCCNRDNGCLVCMGKEEVVPIYCIEYSGYNEPLLYIATVSIEGVPYNWGFNACKAELWSQKVGNYWQEISSLKSWTHFASH